MRAITMTKIILTIALCLFSSNRNVLAIGQQRIVDSTYSKGSFRLTQKDEMAVLYVDSQDYAGVVRAANDLQVDITRITGCTAKITHEEAGLGKNAVLIGAFAAICCQDISGTRKQADFDFFEYKEL